MRRLRLEQQVGLRKFAAQVGISPTYLSKIERDEFGPPAEEKVKAIARALGQDADHLLALAGRVASDLDAIIRKEPTAMASFLRAANGLSPEELNRLADTARRRQRKRGAQHDID